MKHVSPTMPSVLHGRIVHRFELPHREKNGKGKRTISTSVPRAVTGKKKDNSQDDKCERRAAKNDNTNNINCGFIFVSDTKLNCHNEYLLSIPKRFLKLACDAVRLERKVLIRRYTDIPFLEYSPNFNREDGTIPTAPPPSPSSPCAMIAIHDLETFPEGNPEKIASKPTNESNLWTLTQFWRKERLDFQKMKNCQPKFSIVATVDAISPIVTLDPSNPFALVEVYDEENTDVTCVVVLHGKSAMINHAVIHPLDTFIFCDVVYKPWAVQKLLYDDRKIEGSTSSTLNRQFMGRIPSHVFVATRADSVTWKDRTLNKIQQGSSIGRSEQIQNGIPPIITPVHLVTTMLGKICDVQTLSINSGRRKATVIHYLDMILLNPSNCDFCDEEKENDVNSESPTAPGVRPRCRLYLSYFPMSVALQCCLRREAIVQAHNIHLVRLERNNTIRASYGACLRSTLILLKHSTDCVIASTKEAKDSWTNETTLNLELGVEDDETNGVASLSTQPCGQLSISEKTKSLVEPILDAFSKNHSYSNREHQLPAFINYDFRRINQTHLQEIYFKHVKDWEYRSFQGSLHSMFQKDCPVHVPSTWIVNVLLDKNRDDNPTSCGPLKANRRASTRSPYAEFFDHPFCFCTNDDTTNIQDVSCSCYLSVEDRRKSSSRSSELLDLNEIRIAGQRYFENHVSTLLPPLGTSQNVERTCQLRKGFHGSIRVPLRALQLNHWQETFVNKESEGEAGNNDLSNPLYHVGGFVSEVHAPNSSVASIADGTSQIPISFGKQTCHTNINDFILGECDSIMISCLCLGNSATENTKDYNASQSKFPASVSKSISLPALDARDGLLSNCTLVNVRGVLFVTSFQIHCRDYGLHKATTSLSNDQDAVNLEDVASTIENCLLREDFLSESYKAVTMMGMLTRIRFHAKINTDGSHKCCCLTVSSLKRDESKDIESDISCLQALELSVSVAQSTARMAMFNELFAVVCPKVNLMASQRVLASSFWVLGNSGQTCALTFGGSEDISPGSSCSKASIKVTFPSSSLRLTRQGYIRSSCTHNCLDAFFENCRHSDGDDLQVNTFAEKADHQTFDFVGASKVINGMLHQRPCRRNIFNNVSPPRRPIGELSVQHSSAIPLNTLSDLFELIIRGLRAANNASQRTINPSLVRRISNGRFLGVSFCQVYCFCTRCFCPLVSSPSDTTEGDGRIRKRKRENSLEEVSFWHLAHPEEPLSDVHRTLIPRSTVADNAAPTLPKHIQLCNLRCSKNDCPKHVFGATWECSGVLDDSTGQATMYANGDAALTLLGMPAETIRIIEEGVWSTRDGSIQFMKSIPPPKDLRDKVAAIRAERISRRLKESGLVDSIRQLSKQDRAIYLLERHCRSSGRPRRQLDYYVRCKPLAKRDNEMPHLHHTSIDSFLEDSKNKNDESAIIYRGQAASYTLPTLKLELVDCGVHSVESVGANFG